jgi:DNA-binding Lrp family transcriptional regulator
MTRLRLSGTNLERAADHNQRVTLHAIRINGLLTRVELAEITGLTAPAIANITKRLLADGLIEEAGQRRGGRGQPPTKLVINRDACHSIGVNIDRDHITIVLVNFAGETLARVSEEVNFALPDHVRSLYRRSIKEMMRSAGIKEASLVGLGVAVPDDLGLVDLPGRPAAYAKWDKIDMGDLFDKPFSLPIFVENDAAAAAMGEMQLGLGQKHSTFFYILISSGLGGGLVIDGAYFRGVDGRSGELGFMHAPGSGPRDQIQNLVSLSGLAGQLERDGLSLTDVMGVAHLSPAAEKCVGGRLPSTIVERLAERAHDLLRDQATNVPVIAPVARAALSDDAPAVGAAILPFSHFLLPKPGALWKVPATSSANGRAIQPAR